MQSAVYTPKQHRLFAVFYTANIRQGVTLSVHHLTSVGSHFLSWESFSIHSCNFDGCCQRAGIRDHTNFGVLAMMTLQRGNLNAQGQAVALGVPALPWERLEALGWSLVSWFSWGPSLPRLWFPSHVSIFPSTFCRFSTKSWLSQVCHVCQKSMMFGVKCKHCR